MRANLRPRVKISRSNKGTAEFSSKKESLDSEEASMLTELVTEIVGVDGRLDSVVGRLDVLKRRSRTSKYSSLYGTE